MHFAKLAVLASFGLCAVATPTPQSGGAVCSTGPLQCCNSIKTPDDPELNAILAMLGIMLGNGIPVGIECTPVPVFLFCMRGAKWLS